MFICKTQPPLHADILAGDLRDVELISPASLTQIWVALFILSGRNEITYLPVGLNFSFLGDTFV
jgi:hypothetical protein